MTPLASNRASHRRHVASCHWLNLTISANPKIANHEPQTFMNMRTSLLCIFVHILCQHTNLMQTREHPSHTFANL